MDMDFEFDEQTIQMSRWSWLVCTPFSKAVVILFCIGY